MRKILLTLLPALFLLCGSSAHAVQNRNVTINIYITGESVVITPSTGATQTVTTTQTISLGTNKSYTITVNAPAGYGVLSASLVDGTNTVLPTYSNNTRTSSNYHNVATLGPYNVPDSTSAITFNSVLKPIRSVTTNVVAGSGSTNYPGTTYWLESESPLITATAAAHNGVSSVSIGSAPNYAMSPQSVTAYPDSFPINIPNIVANTRVDVGFVYVYTVSPSISGPTGSGNLNPGSSQRVPINGSITFRVIAAAGSKILDVVIDGSTSLGRRASPFSYTFSNVTADHTIQGVFTTPAVNMTNYCSTPAFMSATIKPNLLLMLDNSASMYDLAYTNNNATTACYDNSYVDNVAGNYSGYFDYQHGEAYTYNFTTQHFDPASTTRPSGCAYSTAYFCLTTNADGTPNTFWAKGNFLNWLTASKLDQLKSILTGGKYDAVSGVLIPESRGCLGRRFVKEIPTLDWVTRPTSAGSPVNLTFGVRGPNSYDADYVTKSTQGGKTRIEIFRGNYNADACNAAVTDWSADSQGAIQAGGTGSNTTTCIGSSSNIKTTAYNHIIHLCYRALTGDSDSNMSGERTPLENDCTQAYSTYYQNNPAQITNETSGDAICASSLPHPLMRSNEIGYIGQCWTGGTWDPTLNSGAGGWVNGTQPTWDDTCVSREIRDYCAGAHASDVTDPSDTTQIANTTLVIPSFIMDAGLNALGAPLATMLAHVTKPTPPSNGLIQEFSSVIGFGTMQHNQNGSGSECSATSSIPCAKACQTSGGVFENPTKECFISTDCPTGDSCVEIPHRDGGLISSYIGFAVKGCRTSGGIFESPAIACSANTDCPSGDSCVPLPQQDHSTPGSLIYNIDALQANTWTPLAESFYNAIGYFAHRSDLRLQSGDFDLTDPAKDPSVYTCRDNYALILSDGQATADQNSSVNSLAAAYPGPANQTGLCSGGFLGSKNLDDLVHLAYTHNIRTFNTSGGSTAAPTNKNERITTYVVNTGHGITGTPTDECASGALLLKDAAAAGGTGQTDATMGNDAGTLGTALRNIFAAVASRVTSGTAASILSNSEGSGANLLQAIFYPQKTFDRLNTSAFWIGELQDFWYYIDPFIGNSTVREDTNGDNTLNLKQDYVAQFTFDPVDTQTKVTLKEDTDGNGTGDAVPALDNTRTYVTTNPMVVSADDVRSLWRAGRQLWLMDANARHIYTQLSGTLTAFDHDRTGVDTSVSTHLNTSLSSVYGLFQTSTQAELDGLIDYVRGSDTDVSLRSRGLIIPSIDSTERVWKLGDIISSTPRIQSSNRLNNYHLGPPGGYKDLSYQPFFSSTSYQNRGMAYVGANDGMLHAFKAGKLSVSTSGDQKATLSAGTGGVLGKEEWAFIPKNAIPYLTYLSDPNYPHLNYVDGTPTISDVSIGRPSSCTVAGTPNYWDCPKDYTGGTNWKTVVVTGMGQGGASRASGTDTGDYVRVPVSGLGYSSYFALDVTNQTFDATTGVRNAANVPAFLWEFAHEEMGYALSGPAIVHIAAKKADGVTPDNTKNGRWFAVFGSGPTGPIDGTACQFKGKSDQYLTLFVVDLNASGAWTLNTNYWKITTDIPYAFAGSISAGVIDADRWNTSSTGFYSDDAVYVGYTRNTSSDGTGTWTEGGVLRLLTQESLNPADWSYAKVIDGVGPVTTNISRLQDRKNHKLWLYFGGGRYFYNQDDMGTGRKIYGIKEPCYTASDSIRHDCSAADQLDNGSLTNQTSNPTDALTTSGHNGWYIGLAAEDTDNSLGAERSVTDPVAMTNGVVFFTTYKPTGDPCKFGGRSRMWAAKYNTGFTAPSAALQGKALVQISTGEFKEINIATAFTGSWGRAMLAEMTGKPPGDPPPIVTKSNLKPVRKVLHIQEH